MTRIKTHPQTQRQTPSSKFSHFEGSWDELEAIALEHLDEAQTGPCEGTIVVAVPPDRFFSPVVEASFDSKLWSTFAPFNRSGDARIRTVVRGSKSPAKGADLILSRCEDGWEIVEIDARPTEERMPKDPVSLAKNLLREKRGKSLSHEDLARSVLFWSTHVRVG